MKTHYLRTPNLTAENIKSRILCYRARRDNAAISFQKYHDKFIVHNYGYGGKGWALAPATAKYSVEIFIREIEKELVNFKNQEVAIIGCGIIALMCAIQLLKNGFEKILIIAKDLDLTASSNASGLIYLHNNYRDPFFSRMAVDSYFFYQSLSKNNYDYLSSCVKKIPIYFDSVINSGLEFFVHHKIISPSEKVRIDFGNGTQHQMIIYNDQIFLETAKFIFELKKYLTNQLTFEKRKINSFDEVSQKFIFNCSGLGSIDLNQDNLIIPSLGHIINLKHLPNDLNYALHVKCAPSFLGKNSARRIISLTPKTSIDNLRESGHLGGTFIDRANTNHEEEFEIMIENARKFFGV